MAVNTPLPEWALMDANLARFSVTGEGGLVDAIARALIAAHDRGVEAVAVASATCPLPKPYYRGELAAKIRACKIGKEV